MQLLLLILQLVQTVVDAALSEKFLMSALLAQAALVENQDSVRILNRAEAMGDHQGGTARQQLVERLANQQLSFRIHAGCGLIENQKTRVVRECTREIDQLTLPDGKSRATFVHGCGNSVRERVHELAQADFVNCALYVVARDARRAEPNIGFNRSGKEEGILQHNSEVPAQILQIEKADIDSIQKDLPALDIVETQ